MLDGRADTGSRRELLFGPVEVLGHSADRGQIDLARFVGDLISQQGRTIREEANGVAS